MKYTIAQFIPIILLFFILKYSNHMAMFSHTILGKLIAVLIIIFYTYLDKTIGLFICSIIILYYQSDNVENMLNMNTELNTLENMDNMGNNEMIDKTSILDDIAYVPNKETHGVSYTDIYKEQSPINYELEEQFRKQNCNGNVLKYKEMKVKNEMAQHVFPQMKQTNNSTCNPCDKKCHFSIIESKIETEIEMKPISVSIV